MSGTQFITIRDDLEHGDGWPEGEHDIVTVITGDLADKLRAHHGATGQVEIHQHGNEGGYSECTVEWDWEAWLTIGGVRVGPRRDASGEVEDWPRQIERARSAGRTWRADQIARHLLDLS